MNEDRQVVITKTSIPITSNLDFIKNHMSEIYNKTQSCASFCRDKHTVDSTQDGNKLFLKMNNVMNSYYNAQIKLMEKLGNESNVIVKIGETYEELDKQLASKAGDL